MAPFFPIFTLFFVTFSSPMLHFSGGREIIKLKLSQSALHFYTLEMQTEVKKCFSERQTDIGTEWGGQSTTYPDLSALENMFAGFLLRLSYLDSMRWYQFLDAPQLIASISRCPLADKHLFPGVPWLIAPWCSGQQWWGRGCRATLVLSGTETKPSSAGVWNPPQACSLIRKNMPQQKAVIGRK